MAEQRRFRFGRSLSERWRRSATGETVERIWMRLRQVTLQGNFSCLVMLLLYTGDCVVVNVIV